MLQIGDARVGDPGVVEVELLQVGQTFEMHQPRVGNLGPPEINVNNLALVILCDTGIQQIQRN